jgi:hypothetical protein
MWHCATIRLSSDVQSALSLRLADYLFNRSSEGIGFNRSSEGIGALPFAGGPRRARRRAAQGRGNTSVGRAPRIWTRRHTDGCTSDGRSPGSQVNDGRRSSRFPSDHECVVSPLTVAGAATPSAFRPAPCSLLIPNLTAMAGLNEISVLSKSRYGPSLCPAVITAMCLKLSFIEAMLWRQQAHNLVKKASAAKIAPDPLLRSAPKLSEVVSVVDGIKKRHGVLIEDALIAAINFVPGWQAQKRNPASHRKRL